MSVRIGVLLLILSGVLGACGPKVGTPKMERASCGEEIVESFGVQQASVIVLRPRDRGPLFRPDHLAALDRICQAFEEEMSDDLVIVKCLTNLPIMEGRPSGAHVVVAREELPMTLDEALHFQQLVLQLEFARGDVVDPSGSAATFIHLPHASFDGVDLRALFEHHAAIEAEWFQMAFDGGGPGDATVYREIAGNGPSSSYLVGLFDAGEAGSLKNPESLYALDRFQTAAESLPKVAQSFTIVDDLKVVRRGLHRGNPAEAYVPNKRAEIAQLLLAQSMSPAAGAFGPRIDSTERVALVRVNLAASSREGRQRMARKIDRLLQQEVLPEGRAFICPEG